jgi:hypothetical protein
MTAPAQSKPHAPDLTVAQNGALALVSTADVTARIIERR